MLRAWALTSAVWDGCQTALVVKLWDFIISLGGPSQVGRGAGKAWEGASANSPRWVQTWGSACSEREASSCKHEKVFIQLFKASAKSQTWGICLVCLLRSPLCIWVLCRHTQSARDLDDVLKRFLVAYEGRCDIFIFGFLAISSCSEHTRGTVCLSARPLPDDQFHGTDSDLQYPSHLETHTRSHLLQICHIPGIWHGYPIWKKLWRHIPGIWHGYPKCK